MTVPSEPGGANNPQVGSPLMYDAIRLTAVALPVTVLFIFLGIIWLLGIVIPFAHANSQKTGRQALSLIRALNPPRDGR